MGPDVYVTEVNEIETAPEVEDNRDMQVQEVEVEATPLPTINLLDLMQIGADESNQAFGSWARGDDRCALGAMALGAKKLGLF